MNQVVPLRDGAVRVAEEPILSAPLIDALCWAEEYNADPATITGHALSPAVREEAATVLLWIEGRLRPAGQSRVVTWLGKLNMGLGRPLDPSEFELRSPAVSDAVADLPAAVFTRATVREAARTFEFFPGARALSILLAPHVQKLLRQKRSLERIAGSVSPARPSRPEGQDERDRIVAAFRVKFDRVCPPARTVAEQIEHLGRARPREAHLSGEQLAAARRGARS